jgi:hypothetical protein
MEVTLELILRAYLSGLSYGTKWLVIQIGVPVEVSYCSSPFPGYNYQKGPHTSDRKLNYTGNILSTSLQKKRIRTSD